MAHSDMADGFIKLGAGGRRDLDAARDKIATTLHAMYDELTRCPTCRGAGTVAVEISYVSGSPRRALLGCDDCGGDGRRPVSAVDELERFAWLCLREVYGFDAVADEAERLETLGASLHTVELVERDAAGDD